MPGHGQHPPKPHEWYVVKDEMSDTPVGFVDAHGNTRDTTPEAEARLRSAFASDLLVREGEVIGELGMCFDGVCAVRPSDPAHDALVLRNLGALAGLRPEPATDDDPEREP